MTTTNRDSMTLSLTRHTMQTIESTERGDHVTKAKGQHLLGALILAATLLAAQTGFAQVAGRVAGSGGGPLAGATVQIWDSYPGGTVLTSATTNGAGEFSTASPGVGTFDIRVIKSGCYPTVVRGLPNPISNTTLKVLSYPTRTASPVIADYWDTDTPFLGSNILSGDVIETADPTGEVVTATQFIDPSGTFLIHANGDMPGTVEDEGHQFSEVVSFRINGLPATVDPAPPLYDGSVSGGGGQVQLTGAAIAPGATVAGPIDAVGEAGGSAFIVYQLTNTGGTTETFNFDVSNDNGWTMVTTPTKATSVTLNPGEFSDVVVEVQIPGGAPDQTLEVRFSATSDSYGSANSGAFTILEVSIITGIGDDESGDNLRPSGFALAQNYPNPFNPSTLISFNLPIDGQVRLEVVNIIGQTVRVLVDGFRPAGPSSEIWDGRDQNGMGVPTGIYFYRLMQGSMSEVRKMVLLK